MATRNAVSLSYAAVNEAVNGGGSTFPAAATDGDVVVVPTGTATWSTTLNITKRITLIGAGTITGTTAPHTSDGTGRLTANDQTIILDGTVSNPSGQRSGIVCTWDNGDSIDGFHPRISGIAFRQASSTGEDKNGQTWATFFLTIQGTNHNVRIDNCHFDKIHRYTLLVQGYILGVMDHCIIDQFYGKDLNNANMQLQELIEVYHDAWGATSLPSGYGFSGNSSVATSFGNQSWVDSANLASNQDKFFYFEDCQFNNNYDGTAGAYSSVGCSIDSTFGARFCARYCNWPNGGVAAGHGTETGGQRGERLLLIYRNSSTFPSALGATNIGSLIRSGSQISFDNDYHGTTVTAGPCGLTAGRQAMSTNMGVADGQNSWDLVTTDGSGGIGLGSSGAYVFQSGTATSSTPVTTTVAAGSNGVNINTFTGSGVLNVASTTGFNSSGTLTVAITSFGGKTVSYTGKTSTTLTGCSSTQSGVMGTGNNVTQGQVNTLVDTVAGFTDNQWNGYQLRHDGSGVASNVVSSYITATAATTSKITVGGSTGGQAMGFTVGDAYSMRKNILTVDQASRGPGDLLSGVNSTALNTAAGNTKSWPHQKLEPCYSVGNTLNASGTAYDSTKLFNGYFHSNYPTMSTNRDWYNETTSFDGTVGVGRGVLASRPGTGTNGTDIASGYYTLAYNPPGTAYWATDQGSWNGSGDGRGSGKLQVYAGGAWADYFVPYTYPHPLVQTPVGKIISLSGNMTFGNVITNTTAQSTLSIFNTGDTTLTVTSITYPTGYTGAYSGTIAAGSSHDITITFAPVSQVTYNGTITVNSDATAGTNTVDVTGAGTAPPITNTPNPGREKSAARRITGIGRRM